MRPCVFNEDHEAFRETIRAFIEAEVVPVYDEWFAGQAPREFYDKLGKLGIFGINVPEEFGGAGLDTHKFEAVLYEETSRAGVQFGGSGVHVLLALPYIKMLSTDEQKKRYLPKFVTGEEMWALAMTEPGTGSDVAGMKTTAKLSEDGTHYVLNGAKTSITGGVHADRVIVLRPHLRPGPPLRHLPLRRRHEVRGLLGRPQARQVGPQDLRHRRAGVRRRQGPRRGPHGRGEQGLRLPRHQPGLRALGHRLRCVRAGRLLSGSPRSSQERTV
ncbi:putative acyl-CoA dehydrogenase [Streptomyces tanashiensis]